MPSTARRLLLLAVLALGIVLHGSALQRGWKSVKRSDSARDFASYYYAVQVAADGGDPYDTAALSKAARAEGTRKAVHPFFYPPPYLLTMVWALPLSLEQSYRLWFWLNSLFLLAAMMALWKWAPSGGTVLALAACLGLLTAIPNNHVMGQANVPVMALMLWGLWLADQGRERLGGVLLGLACMMKMAPGLLVLWWFIDGRPRAALAACGAAILLSVASVPIVGLELQWRFFTEVLPGFGSGDYHGLSVPITLFGNHSIPNIWVQIFPGAGAMSTAARVGSTLTNLGLIALVFAAVRGHRDPLSRLGAVGALSILMIIVPVYAYEHHLVLLTIPAVAVGAALSQRRLSRRWLLLLVPAAVGLGWRLSDLKRFAQSQGELVELGLQELRFVSLLALLLVSVLVARSVPASEG